MADSPRDRRRSRRLLVQMPAVLKGIDAAGRVFFDRTEILSIDQFGARVRTRFRLTVGTGLQLELPTEKQPLQMRVIWCGDEGSVYEGTVGVEFVDQDQTWSAATLRAR